MGRRVCAAIAAGTMMLSMTVEAGARSKAPEGCEAANPAQSTCTFTVMEDMSGPVAGVAGRGDWLVKVKRGKETIKLKSPAGGAPTAVEFLFRQGDKVTASALSPGSGLIVGGD
jgi:hypothetical protein